MSNFIDFSSDMPNAFLLLLDASGSMEDDVYEMREGLQAYKESFENFSGAKSIAVSVCHFNDTIYIGKFQEVSEMSTSYSTGGVTALYYAIEEAAKHLENYISEVIQKKGIKPRATFIVFSDGESNHDKRSRQDAQKVINRLNYAGVTTVFIAFGSAMHSSFGKAMGFMSVIDVEEREKLTSFMGEELSKSCKEQSKSMKSLGANFFSKAMEKSEEYSQATTQVLEDDSWIDDL